MNKSSLHTGISTRQVLFYKLLFLYLISLFYSNEISGQIISNSSLNGFWKEVKENRQIESININSGTSKYVNENYYLNINEKFIYRLTVEDTKDETINGYAVKAYLKLYIEKHEIKLINDSIIEVKNRNSNTIRVFVKTIKTGTFDRMIKDADEFGIPYEIKNTNIDNKEVYIFLLGGLMIFGGIVLLIIEFRTLVVYKFDIEKSLNYQSSSILVAGIGLIYFGIEMLL